MTILRICYVYSKQTPNAFTARDRGRLFALLFPKRVGHQAAGRQLDALLAVEIVDRELAAFVLAPGWTEKEWPKCRFYGRMTIPAISDSEMPVYVFPIVASARACSHREFGGNTLNVLSIRRSLASGCDSCARMTSDRNSLQSRSNSSGYLLALCLSLATLRARRWSRSDRAAVSQVC